MRYALVENGKVINIIEAAPEYAEKIGAIPIGDIGVAIGNNYSNGKFTITTTDNVIIEVEPIEIVPEPEPLSIDEKY